MNGISAMRFVRATLSTGVTLHCAVRGDPAAAPPVLLLHGLADSWQAFALVLEALPARLPVIAPDLRGHGDSDRPASGYAMADHAADMAALLDFLRVPKAVAAGHSMGSFVAQALAAAHPDRVGGLVLMASGPGADTPAIRDFLAEVRTLADPVPRGFVEAFQEPSGPVPAAFLRAVVDQSLKLPAFVWKEALAGLAVADHRALLPGVACPAAVAWGERDGLFPRADQDELLALLPGAPLWTYDAGHALHWERPREFAADLTRFLAG